MLEVWIDGACEPTNPGGTASYGIVVYQNGIRLWSKAAIIGHGRSMSNNVAEYCGFTAFLNWYRENGSNDKATIHSDSQLLVNQMKGIWGVHGGLYLPYYEKATELLTQEMFERFKFKWIPREENWEADKLSKDILLTHGVRIDT